MAIDLYFIEGFNSQKMEMAFSLSIESMNKQQFNVVRRYNNVVHVHNISHIGSHNIIGKEVIMFVCETAAVEFEIAPGSFFSKIEQFWKILSSYCY